ncbi:hypothetical protein N9901_02085 [Flavobacteriaceae bacterium]|nr:hypothetical protein [Flavobacteriaceae bacterium]
MMLSNLFKKVSFFKLIFLFVFFACEEDKVTELSTQKNNFNYDAITLEPKIEIRNDSKYFTIGVNDEMSLPEGVNKYYRVGFDVLVNDLLVETINYSYSRLNDNYFTTGDVLLRPFINVTVFNTQTEDILESKKISKSPLLIDSFFDYDVKIDSIIPKLISYKDTLTIYGKNFCLAGLKQNENTKIRVGLNDQKVTYLSDSVLKVVLNSNTSKRITTPVLYNCGLAVESPSKVEIKKHQIESIANNQGNLPKSILKIKGSNFITDYARKNITDPLKTKVFIDSYFTELNTKGLEIVSYSDTELNVKIPAGLKPGNLDVKVVQMNDTVVLSKAYESKSPQLIGVKESNYSINDTITVLGSHLKEYTASSVWARLVYDDNRAESIKVLEVYNDSIKLYLTSQSYKKASKLYFRMYNNYSGYSSYSYSYSSSSFYDLTNSIPLDIKAPVIIESNKEAYENDDELVLKLDNAYYGTHITVANSNFTLDKSNFNKYTNQFKVAVDKISFTNSKLNSDGSFSVRVYNQYGEAKEILSLVRPEITNAYISNRSIKLEGKNLGFREFTINDEKKTGYIRDGNFATSVPYLFKFGLYKISIGYPGFQSEDYVFEFKNPFDITSLVLSETYTRGDQLKLDIKNIDKLKDYHVKFYISNNKDVKDLKWLYEVADELKLEFDNNLFYVDGVYEVFLKLYGESINLGQIVFEEPFDMVKIKNNHNKRSRYFEYNKEVYTYIGTSLFKMDFNSSSWLVVDDQMLNIDYHKDLNLIGDKLYFAIGSKYYEYSIATKTTLEYDLDFTNITQGIELSYIYEVIKVKDKFIFVFSHKDEKVKGKSLFGCYVLSSSGELNKILDLDRAASLKINLNDKDNTFVINGGVYNLKGEYISEYLSIWRYLLEGMENLPTPFETPSSEVFEIDNKIYRFGRYDADESPYRRKYVRGYYMVYTKKITYFSKQ